MSAPPPRCTHDPDLCRDIAHVGPVELYTPVLEQSRDLFVDVLALREVHRDATSVYLHTWDDYQSWTVRLVQRDTAGIGRTYLRAASPRALGRLAAAIDAAGLRRGHVADRPALKNQAAAYPGRGANVRRLDHVNYLTADVPATATSRSPPTPARRSCAPRTSASTRASTSRPACTSTPSSRPSSCTCGSLAATGSRSATPVPA
jgi:catechol 2,3-dioxygenase-like lactoylglutathione lyase family enzyme